MKNTLLAAGLSALLLTASAYADEPEAAAQESEAEETVKHYEAPKPITKAEAYDVFNTSNAELNTLGEKEQLSGNELERIHQLSYGLENAVETLRLNASSPEQQHAVNALAETIEEIHEASERHEEDYVKEQLNILKSRLAIVRGVVSAED